MHFYLLQIEIHAMNKIREIHIFKGLLFFVFCIFFCRVDAQQLAFPGAEGFGKFSSGGRGGRVVAVDNLNDKGVGSFRQALEAFPAEPIIVIFKVSGIIELVTPIVIKRSNITIAGQTAPGGGIFGAL